MWKRKGLRLLNGGQAAHLGPTIDIVLDGLQLPGLKPLPKP